MKRYGLHVSALVALVLTVLLVACDGSGPPSTESLTPAGFLPIPTLTPAPQDVDQYIHERSDLCPGYSREACLQPGDHVNVYQALSMERAVAVQVLENQVEQWILDPEVAQRVLREFDSKTDLEPRTAGPRQILLIGVVWAPGDGLPHYGETQDRIELIADVDLGVVGWGRNVQWRMPEGLLDLILASASRVTPTTAPPTPVPTLPPRPTLTPTIVPPHAVFFDHPEGELRWEGPDDRVYTLGRGHCEAPQETRDAYGIPALIAIEDETGFWFSRVIPGKDGWRWTGYYHDDWQIWQGDDSRSVYLLDAEEPRIAFEYRAYGCI